MTDKILELDPEAFFDAAKKICPFVGGLPNIFSNNSFGNLESGDGSGPSLFVEAWSNLLECSPNVNMCTWPLRLNKTSTKSIEKIVAVRGNPRGNLE